MSSTCAAVRIANYKFVFPVKDLTIGLAVKTATPQPPFYPIEKNADFRWLMICIPPVRWQRQQS